jgi:hypothetical protein
MLIQIKFNNDRNNNELLKTLGKHKKERRKVDVIGSVQQPGAQVGFCIFVSVLCNK